MLKNKHRVCSILLAVLLFFSMAAVLFTGSASAAGTVIYFEKPDTWNDTVRIHYWGSQGTSWPGAAMTQLSGKYYSYELPAGNSQFVLSDGNTAAAVANQTVDLPFSSANAGQMITITTQNGTADNGAKKWNAAWVDFPGLGLSVSATPGSSDFVDTLDVTLHVNAASSAVYSIDGGEEQSFSDGDILTIGAQAELGDVITLRLAASDADNTVEETYTYTKAAAPSGNMAVYFDNSLDYEEPHIYAWGEAEFSKWPGEKMLWDDENGLYYYVFTDDTLTYENIIINDGKDGGTDPTAQQYPEKGSFKINSGECKLLTDGVWIDYGKPNAEPAGFVYTPAGTKFSTETLRVKLGLKNAESGTYNVDGTAEIPFKEGDMAVLGEGKIGNSTITLTIKATNGSQSTTTDYTFTKVFTPDQTTFASSSDGHTTQALGGYYATNPNLQLGKEKTITVDGDPGDWDSSMIVAQGVANDDARVYMPSSIHERAWDDYALYAAWDDENLYFMWEMANVSAILGGDSIFSAQKPNGSPWNPGAPVFLALSIDPEKSGSGKAKETDKVTGNVVYSDYVWGSTKDGGMTYGTHIDTIIAFDTANTNGGSAIIKLDDDGYFNYDTSIPIGRLNNNPGTPNQNGFQIAWDYGTLSKTLLGINGYGGERTLGDTYSLSSNWIDFFEVGYTADRGFIYEVAIPLANLDIDKTYLEENGIGVMKISTMGTSGLNSLPMDPSMLDNADVEYSYDPSTSHEKEDVDHITVPLARVGALLADTVITPAEFQVDFGVSELARTQQEGGTFTLKAVPYNGTEPYRYAFSVKGEDGFEAASGQIEEDTYTCTVSENGTYTISVTVTDNSGKTLTVDKTFSIGKAAEPTQPTQPTQPPTEDDTSGDGYQLGDVNDDGQVNIEDVLVVQKHIASMLKLDGNAYKAADVDQNGKIEVADVLLIQKRIANMIPPFA